MIKSSMSEQENIIKDSLFTLVKKHVPSAKLSDIDEIVLSYVISILEDLGSEADVEVSFVLFYCKLLKFTIQLQISQKEKSKA